MTEREHMHEAIMMAVEEQISDEGMAEAREALARLESEGWSTENAKKLIGQCLIVEFFDINKHNKPFDKGRYVNNLNNLPESPFGDDLEGPVFDRTIRREMFYSEEYGSDFCPKCKSPLYVSECEMLLGVMSSSVEGDFQVDIAESFYCTECPTIVFDRELIEDLAKEAGNQEDLIVYVPFGILDMEDIPVEMRHEIEFTDDNPMPLVEFLPNNNTKPRQVGQQLVPIRRGKKIGRNESCPCGSGRKYKKCCAKMR